MKQPPLANRVAMRFKCIGQMQPREWEIEWGFCEVATDLKCIG